MDSMHLSPLHSLFATEVTGVSLVDLISQRNDTTEEDIRKTQTISKIEQLVHEFKVVVFRNQGTLSAHHQLCITKWFGEVDCAGFERHTKSPDPSVLRVSNDAEEGFRDFGTSGFHIDGSFMEKPNSFSIYHIIHNPTKGGTVFVPLSEVYCQLNDRQKSEWERLWLVKTYKNVKNLMKDPGFVIHPFVYPHPETGDKTLCVHQGKTSRFIRDWGLNVAKWITKEETALILKEAEEQLNCTNPTLRYDHKWQDGDVIITDNLSVAHLALPETQLPPSDVGLRVMHRTIVKGTNRPWKNALGVLAGAISSKTIDIEVNIDDIEEDDEQVIRAHSFGNEKTLRKIRQTLY